MKAIQMQEFSFVRGQETQLVEHLLANPTHQRGAFRMSDMYLLPDGTLHIRGEGEFALSPTALGDIFSYAHIPVGVVERYAKENLALTMCETINAYLGTQTDMLSIVYQEHVGRNVALGIPSASYAFVPNSSALKNVKANLPSDFSLERATVHPESMEVSFTCESGKIVDHIGEIVKVGVSLRNSEGTRFSALSLSGMTYRLICANGAVAKTPMYQTRMIHRGSTARFLAHDLHGVIRNTGRLAQLIPKMGEIAVDERTTLLVKPALEKVLGKKESIQVLQDLRREGRNIADVWNLVTDMPKRVSSQAHRLLLENTGFAILEDVAKRN